MREGRGSGLQSSNSVWERGGSVSEGRVSMKDGEISVREMMNTGSSQFASASCDTCVELSKACGKTK